MTQTEPNPPITGGNERADELQWLAEKWAQQDQLFDPPISPVSPFQAPRARVRVPTEEQLRRATQWVIQLYKLLAVVVIVPSLLALIVAMLLWGIKHPEDLITSAVVPVSAALAVNGISSRAVAYGLKRRQERRSATSQPGG